MPGIQAILQHPLARLMRLHQPVGIWLLLWPCWWSVAMGPPGPPSPLLLLAFLLGAALMRSAGCIINDLWDRDFDREVERTRGRPLASGEVSPAQACLLLMALLLGAFAVALLLGPHVMLWSAAALPLVIVYPLMKRFTWWPQLFLGLTFNWGALLGSVALCGGVGEYALLLYLAGIGWTLVYDTISAHQDKQDDARIGVKSTALALEGETKPFVAACYGFTLLMLAGAGILAMMRWPYYIALLAVGGHFLWQIRRVNLSDPVSCRRIFVSNVYAGLLVFVAILLGRFHLSF